MTDHLSLYKAVCARWDAERSELEIAREMQFARLVELEVFGLEAAAIVGDAERIHETLSRRPALAAAAYVAMHRTDGTTDMERPRVMERPWLHGLALAWLSNDDEALRFLTWPQALRSLRPTIHARAEALLVRAAAAVHVGLPGVLELLDELATPLKIRHDLLREADFTEKHAFGRLEAGALAEPVAHHPTVLNTSGQLLRWIVGPDAPPPAGFQFGGNPFHHEPRGLVLIAGALALARDRGRHFEDEDAICGSELQFLRAHARRAREAAKPAAAPTEATEYLIEIEGGGHVSYENRRCHAVAVAHPRGPQPEVSGDVARGSVACIGAAMAGCRGPVSWREVTVGGTGPRSLVAILEGLDATNAPQLTSVSVEDAGAVERQDCIALIDRMAIRRGIGLRLLGNATQEFASRMVELLSDAVGRLRGRIEVATDLWTLSTSGSGEIELSLEGNLEDAKWAVASVVSGFALAAPPRLRVPENWPAADREEIDSLAAFLLAR